MSNATTLTKDEPLSSTVNIGSKRRERIETYRSKLHLSTGEKIDRLPDLINRLLDIALKIENC